MNEIDHRQLAARLTQEANSLGRGDLSALGRIFDLCSVRLLRYARTVTGNPYDAEDAVQSAMVAIARHPQALATAQSPWAYFLVVVRHEAHRLIRRRRSGHLLIDTAGAIDDASPLEREEFQEHVRKAVRRLPPEQAEVVLLKIWEKMTFVEIAGVIGESPNTVASRYRYALEKLSRTLRSVGAEEITHVE